MNRRRCNIRFFAVFAEARSVRHNRRATVDTGPDRELAAAIIAHPGLTNHYRRRRSISCRKAQRLGRNAFNLEAEIITLNDAIFVFNADLLADE